MTVDLYKVTPNVMSRCVQGVYNMNGSLGYAFNHLLLATTKKSDVCRNINYE